MKIIFTNFVGLFLLILFSACSVGPNIETDQDIVYDLSKYKTFRIENPSKEEGSSQISLNPILYQRIERAIRSNLINKNLTESTDSDLIVRFYLATDREIDRSQSFNTYRRGFYNDSNQKYHRVDKDSFSIRLHDSQSDEVIWYAFSRFSRSNTPKDQSDVNSLIDKALNSFSN